MSTKKINRKRLFYDIETSFCEGYFWRPGYNQRIFPTQIRKHTKIICISWKWEGSDKVYNVTWDKDQCDKRVLDKFIPVLNKADEIVAHNGDRFDIKIIRTRAIFHGLEFHHSFKSIDTLKLCKKYLSLPSNKLDEVAKYYGLEAKRDDGGIDTWVNIIYNKCKKSLKTMVYYCDGDIITLEQVYRHLRPYVQHNYNYAVSKGGEKHACPECGSHNVHYHSKYVTRAGTPQHYLRCRDEFCQGYTFKINNKTYQDWLQFKMINGIK